MGKSTVARMFESRGVPVFDADAVVHRLQSQDSEMIEAIGRRFPNAVRDGVIDRPALSKEVIGNSDRLLQLEAIVHPAVQAERARFIREHGSAKALMFEIPLVFETAAAEQFDKVIVVSAPPQVQRERVLLRADMTEGKLDAILVRQMPDAEKRKRADFVIETGGHLSTVETQVDAILSCLGLAATR